MRITIEPTEHNPDSDPETQYLRISVEQAKPSLSGGGGGGFCVCYHTYRRASCSGIDMDEQLHDTLCLYLPHP